MNDLQQSQLLKLREVASILNISRTALYDLLEKGQLESVKIGRSRRILTEDLVRFIKSLKTNQADRDGEEITS